MGKHVSAGPGRIFVISAPSGTGKTTIAARLAREIPSLHSVTTVTTRSPRRGERDGTDYHFVTRRAFEEMIEEGRFAEWAEVYGNYYGTPLRPLLDTVDSGKSALLCIDTQGGINIRKRFPESLLIAVLPPSLPEQERRIRRRSRMPEKEIRNRLEAARSERKTLRTYDYRVINRTLETTIRKIRDIIEDER